jgi:hypothetical protein
MEAETVNISKAFSRNRTLPVVQPLYSSWRNPSQILNLQIETPVSHLGQVGIQQSMN